MKGMEGTKMEATVRFATDILCSIMRGKPCPPIISKYPTEAPPKAHTDSIPLTCHTCSHS